MAREPSYPEDAPVGAAASEAGATGSSETEPAPEHPQAAAEKRGIGEAAEAAAAAKASDPRRARHLVTGAAIGIGSAALVAALLYANRSKKGDRRDG